MQQLQSGVIEGVPSTSMSLSSGSSGDWYGAPQLLQRLGPRVAFVGESVRLEARVYGARPFRYRWLHDGEPVALPSARHRVRCDESSGELCLLIENCTLQDAGSYALVVQNSEGSLRSEEVKLEVRVREQLANAPFDSGYVSQLLPPTCVACENTSVWLVCEFSLPPSAPYPNNANASAPAHDTCTWLHDGMPVASDSQPNSRISISIRATNEPTRRLVRTQLCISAVRRDDEGTYCCTYKQSSSSTSALLTRTVLRVEPASAAHKQQTRFPLDSNSNPAATARGSAPDSLQRVGPSGAAMAAPGGGGSGGPQAPEQPQQFVQSESDSPPVNVFLHLLQDRIGVEGEPLELRTQFLTGALV